VVYGWLGSLEVSDGKEVFILAKSKAILIPKNNKRLVKVRKETELAAEYSNINIKITINYKI